MFIFYTNPGQLADEIRHQELHSPQIKKSTVNVNKNKITKMVIIFIGLLSSNLFKKNSPRKTTIKTRGKTITFMINPATALKIPIGTNKPIIPVKVGILRRKNTR